MRQGKGTSAKEIYLLGCRRLPSKLFLLAAFDCQVNSFPWLPSTAKKNSLLGYHRQPRKFLYLAALDSQENTFPWQLTTAK